jgi:NADPH:quinone reductase-like Zn-dependent oxidoreductase
LLSLVYSRHAKGVRSGCDFAGEVAALGPDVPKGAWSDGDRVGGFVAGGMSETNGAYADFVLVPYDHLFRIPSKLSFAAAASIPIPAYTAVQALYLRLGLPEPDVETATRATEGPWLLVWSASTAVGQYAVQLGALSGYRIVATASPERHDHVKSLGASLVFDYKVCSPTGEVIETWRDWRTGRGRDQRDQARDRRRRDARARLRRRRGYGPLRPSDERKGR